MAERHRVAVVIFADADGVDARDAANVAAVTIRTALAGGEVFADMPIILTAPLKHVQRTVRVVDVTDLGVAAGNGYLWTAPTARAWRERGLTLEPVAVDQPVPEAQG